LQSRVVQMAAIEGYAELDALLVDELRGFGTDVLHLGHVEAFKRNLSLGGKHVEKRGKERKERCICAP